MAAALAASSRRGGGTSAAGRAGGVTGVSGNGGLSDMYVSLLSPGADRPTWRSQEESERLRGEFPEGM
ncbi:hypothetical protein GCM10010330_35230 [Streptomyces tendae]|nr:hypothetical protein GCM10010330_35230 [Streptomyces tendae]